MQIKVFMIDFWLSIKNEAFLDRLKSPFLDGYGSGIKKRLADDLSVVSFEEFNGSLANTFIGGILELNIKLDIPLNIEAVIGSPPLATNLPFGLAREEVKERSFGLGDYDREEFPVLGFAGLLNRPIVEESVQFVLYGLD